MTLPDFSETDFWRPMGSLLSAALTGLVTWRITKRRSMDHILVAIDEQRKADLERLAIDLKQERDARDAADEQRRTDRRSCDDEIAAVHRKYVEVYTKWARSEERQLDQGVQMRQLRADVELYRASMQPEGLVLLDILVQTVRQRSETVPHSSVPA